MSKYLNDPREKCIIPKSGVTLEDDNRFETMYHDGPYIVDLCDLPVDEYMAPMSVAVEGEGGGGEIIITKVDNIENISNDLFYDLESGSVVIENGNSGIQRTFMVSYKSDSVIKLVNTENNEIIEVVYNLINGTWWKYIETNRTYIEEKTPVYYDFSIVDGIPDNAICNVGEISVGNKTVVFTLRPYEEDGFLHVYNWTFDIGDYESPTIVWPNEIISWCNGGSPPVIVSNTHYEIFVRDGYATYLAFKNPYGKP